LRWSVEHLYPEY